MNTRMHKPLDDWDCVDQFLAQARIDIARGQYMKATAIGMIATSEFMDQQGMIAEDWAGYGKGTTK